MSDPSQRQGDRVLGLESVHNFRDYGGYALPGGARLRRGLLWRSGQHHGATSADLAVIGGLGLGAVLDLRSLAERTSHPCRRPAGFAARVYLLDEPERSGVAEPAPANPAAHLPRRRDADETRAMMAKTYRSMPFRPMLVAGLRRFLADLPGIEGASLVNCMAGKDRTGVSVALIQAALGVHLDDIMEDYLLTRVAGDPAARIRAGAETIAAQTNSAQSGGIDADVLAVLMGVETDYLAGTLVAIDERHGSLDAYLAAELGLDARARARLAARFVEG